MGFKNIEDIKMPEFSFADNDIDSLQNECLRLKLKCSLPPTIHLILISTIYPFLLELTHQLHLYGTASQQTEI